MTSKPKSRNYCFTINNYTKKELKQFEKIAESLEQHRYICYGLEVGEKKKTPHIQAYIQFEEAKTLIGLQNYIGIKRNKKILKFHAEIANGTPEQNKKYCGKENLTEYGEAIMQGTRTDLVELKNMIRENPKDLNEIIDKFGNNYQQIRFTQILQPIYFKHRDPASPPTVFWLFGKTGVGKTRLVYETFGDICSVSDYKWLGTGYTQNECFLLDDFREHSLSFEDVLKITDRFPYTLPVKGSSVPLNSPFIILTSPNDITDSFMYTKEDLGQLLRRVTQIDLNAVDDIKQIDLRNLDEKYIYKGNNYDSDLF